jgi:hypothetical protein
MDLIQELGSIIAGRRQPGLWYALDAARNILRDHPDAVDDRFKRSVLTGLDYLLPEAAYRAWGGEQDRIPYDRVPDYRARAAEIALILSRETGYQSDVTRQWLYEATNDPLPGVRRAVSAQS